MAPLFNGDGQLLGHVDLNRCWKNHDCYMVDEGARRIGFYKVVKEPSDTVRIFRFPVKRIRFRWGAEDEQTVRYLVCDDPIPDWVWKAAGIKFDGHRDWQSEYG